MATLSLVLFLASCTSYRAFQQGREHEKVDNWDEAVQQYAKALEVDPGNNRYKVALQRARLEASRIHFEKAKSLKAAGHYDLAALELELVVKLDPTNQYAAIELAKVIKELRERQHRENRTIADKKKRASEAKAQPPELNPASNEPISLSFPRETSIKDIYQALGNSFGINILFDDSVKDDRITIELRDVTAQEALERVMQAGGHFYKVLDERTIMVVADTPQLRREFEDLVIRTFYLSNGDAEQVTNVLRTMLEARNVFALKALNAITIRDTADKVKIAEKIIEANDKAKAEVVIDVELLQLDVKKARDLGMQFVSVGGGAVSSYSPFGTLIGPDGNPLTQIFGRAGGDDITDISFNVPSVAYGFVKSNSDAQLLAKPQLRISEGEKATLTIGERIPVPVTTFTTANIGGGTNTGAYAPFTSYQYQDVGIKIAIEPRVHHNREVSLKLTVEVSNLAGYAPNSTQPIIATRTIESTIRLQDGETNFLAGLIRRDDTAGRNTTPFLGDLPLLGRIFSRETTDRSTTDLVLTMTPNIVRIPDITDEDLAPMWVGTQSNITFRGFSPRMESKVGGDPFERGPEQEQFLDQNANPTFAPETPPPPPGYEQQPESGTVPEGGTAPDNPFNRQPPRPIQQESTLQKEDVQSFARPVPRIALQPVTVALQAGVETQWRLIGLDLEGISTPEIVLNYDPTSLQISGVEVGSAIVVRAVRPAVQVDPSRGSITIRNDDGSPIAFESGGEVVTLQLRALKSGESFVVLHDSGLRADDGLPIIGALAGGKAIVE